MCQIIWCVDRSPLLFVLSDHSHRQACTVHTDRLTPMCFSTSWAGSACHTALGHTGHPVVSWVNGLVFNKTISTLRLITQAGSRARLKVTQSSAKISLYSNVLFKHDESVILLHQPTGEQVFTFCVKLALTLYVCLCDALTRFFLISYVTVSELFF